MSKYEKPSITVDTVLIERQVGRVCMIKRKSDPFKDCWALPGGFFNPVDILEKQIVADVSIERAGKRELLEEVGVDLVSSVIDYQLAFVMDTIGRDPRGRVVSFVYVAEFSFFYPQIKAQDDAKECQWFFVEDLLLGKVPLAFDHQEILARVWRDLTR